DALDDGPTRSAGTPESMNALDGLRRLYGAFRTLPRTPCGDGQDEREVCECDPSSHCCRLLSERQTRAAARVKGIFATCRRRSDVPTASNCDRFGWSPALLEALRFGAVVLPCCRVGPSSSHSPGAVLRSASAARPCGHRRPARGRR